MYTYEKQHLKADATHLCPGMSVKIGHVVNGKKTYVAGAPRSNHSGQVVMFVPNGRSLKTTPKLYLTGKQFGSCFGYDLAIVDLNSDGFVLCTYSI